MYQPIKLVDVELNKPLADIENLQNYSGVLGLVRLHGEPLGQIWIPVSGDRCTANKIRIAILEEHSWSITQTLVNNLLADPQLPLDPQYLMEAAPHTSIEYQPLVTVAVCTRDRSTNLRHCLAALMQLDYANLDLLVVDNAPSDTSTRKLVEMEFPQIRYVIEPRPGLDWARNRAIEEAHGEIIAYTDDDVAVDKLWATALARAFVENPETMCVTGLVMPAELETEAQWLFEQYGGFNRGYEPHWYTVDRAYYKRTSSQYGWAGLFGTGANMAFRRTLFGQIGMFDEALDVGTITNGGGDIEMFFRVLHEGYTLIYEPRAIVHHYHRAKYSGLRRQIADNGVGFTAYLVRTAMHYPAERISISRFWLRRLFGWHLIRLINSYRGKEKFPRDLIKAELWGYLIGLRRYPTARHKAKNIELEFQVDYSEREMVSP